MEQQDQVSIADKLKGEALTKDVQIFQTKAHSLQKPKMRRTLLKTATLIRKTTTSLCSLSVLKFSRKMKNQSAS